MMTVGPRIFSLEEANNLLPTIGRIMESIQEKQQHYIRRHDMLFFHELLSRAENGARVPENGNAELQQETSELEEAVTELQGDIEKIRELGGLVRNIENGWVDFLGQKNGKKIYFCWKRGESSIRHYRDLDSDVHDRRPLDF